MNTKEFLKRISENKLQFKNISFDDIEVSRVTISNCNFVGCNFIDHCFNNVKFINCRFDRCNFDDTRFKNNILEDCFFIKCIFDMARMYGKYRSCIWIDCVISYADNSDSYFDKNSFFSCQFESGCLHEAIFSDCNLVNTWFADLYTDTVCFEKTAIIDVSIDGRKLPNTPSFSKQF